MAKINRKDYDIYGIDPNDFKIDPEDYDFHPDENEAHNPYDNKELSNRISTSCYVDKNAHNNENQENAIIKVGKGITAGLVAITALVLMIFIGVLVVGVLLDNKKQEEIRNMPIEEYYQDYHANPVHFMQWEDGVVYSTIYKYDYHYFYINIQKDEPTKTYVYLDQSFPADSIKGFEINGKFSSTMISINLNDIDYYVVDYLEPGVYTFTGIYLEKFGTDRLLKVDMNCTLTVALDNENTLG